MSQLLGSAIWQLELFSHYVPHVTILLWCSFFVFPQKRSRLSRGGLFTISVTLSVWCFSPLPMLKNWFFPEDTIKTNILSRVVYQNVKINNQNPHGTISQLLKHSPDVMILVEAGGPYWNTALKNIHNQYPIYCGDSQPTPFAMQVFIKDSKAMCEISYIAEFPVIKIIQSDNKVIYGIHPPPPINAHLAAAQRDFFSQFKTMLSSKQNTMVVGDMNTSGYSPIYRKFMENSGLKSMTLNVLPTWLPFGLGIDHVLSNSIQPIEVHPLGWNGSDHRGFLIQW
ncbi:MAG: hypothetical protein KGV50_04460 [Gammaproteobacteria bacterium]|nr:hypothetical protein [Gammaproteobacteria bacterium]